MRDLRPEATNQRSSRPWILGGLLALAAGGCSGSGSPRIALVRGNGSDAFEVRGLERARLDGAGSPPLDWNTAFTVSVEADDPPGAGGALPPVIGSVRVEGAVLRFEPRYPLEPGVRYRARLETGPWREPGGEPLEQVFALEPRALEPTTVVERIYPTAPVLPENQLKFYIHFSRPMRRGQAYRRIHLIESGGKEVDSPFLELGEELWDPSGTRFTLFIDPGRIKRGVLPREQVGPSLESGKSYTLLIDGSWPDAVGAPLHAEFRKEFRVEAPDYETPDPARWKIIPPRAGTSDALVVQFPEPLDAALLLRLLWVKGPGKQPLEGTSSLGAEEREWRFQPRDPWLPGRHELRFETLLEDLAGNSVGRPFEVDEVRRLEERLEPAEVGTPFEVAG
jgi:hypothetical protein